MTAFFNADNAAYITFNRGKIFLVTAHAPPEARE